MDVDKELINSKAITEFLGIGSNIYIQALDYLKEQMEKEKLYEVKFLKWKEIFGNFYGYEISSDLFLKHTYFTHVLKIIVITKSTDTIYNFAKICNEYDKNCSKNIFECDFFYWTKFNKEIIRKIYNKFKNVKFAKEDLFSYLYQQVFLSEIRHRIGEFFTPSDLVKKMVEDVYKIGSKVLDPSCGPGNFIINIIIKIIDSKEPIKSKEKAISNIFGFDINPLAIMTVKANISLLLYEYFYEDNINISNLNIFLINSLFPEPHENEIDFNKLFNSFDLVIGNPPWLTYKDLQSKAYQIKVRNLANKLGIKPPSQYITHIELAAIFFFAIPSLFLAKNRIIFFVMPKSVLNGDHCHKFRAFSLFNKNLEIWDFPKHYFFNVNHICLKAEYIGEDNKIPIQEKYPIKTKLYNSNLELVEETLYSSLKIDDDGAKLLLPLKELEVISKLETSPYRNKFHQGATLVPRTLIFFNIIQKRNKILIISSDSDILSRSKKQWKFPFKNKEIEDQFQFKTFLNMNMLPFHIKYKKNVFLPINEQYDFDLDFLKEYPKALKFYQEMDAIYQKNKKKTSKINTLFANLNYWNKLKKQFQNKSFIVVYNASGSNLKSAVINNQKQNLIIGSENYYYSTDSQNEAFYLAAVLNAPILTKYIKLVKSSRHIHKRVFNFPIPHYDEKNMIHKELAKKGKKYHTIVQDLFLNNPKIQSSKVRLIINQKLMKLDKLTKKLIFE
ncbi:MAG: Eco57I restriction-modification methylase domain-containing protein [Candidatus Heimdallarchaeota archaeon]